MAIDINDYISVKNESSLKIHRYDHKKFLFDFRYEGKRYRKTYLIKQSNWDKRMCVNDAKSALQKFKDDLCDGYQTTTIISVEKLFDLYYGTLDHSKKWTVKKAQIFKLYIQDTIGKKPIDNVRSMDIQKIIATMGKKKLSPRTQKSVLEVLKPLFLFAVKNKYIKQSPAMDINVKIPNQKKVVTGATDLFTKIYTGITSYYSDDPFYKALFLFGFTGRRKSEILNLQWQNIDFINDYYWIEDTKNGDKQKYPLPPMIKSELLNIADDRSGLVFKSPVTQGTITNIDRQMRQLKEYTGIENLSLHYMRNVLVSMLAEQKTEAIVLSGILGHKDVNTINKYLSINHYKSGQIGLRTIDTILDIEM